MRAKFLFSLGAAIYFTGVLCFSQNSRRITELGCVVGYKYASPTVDNPGRKTILGHQKLVSIKDATFLAIKFGKVVLGNGSYLEIRSLEDGNKQKLTSEIIKEYGLYSAYFNGDSVVVSLYAGPRTRGNMFTIEKVAKGYPGDYLAPMSICGSDDRVLSSDKREGRAIIWFGSRIGVGTAWLIDGEGCMVTAGHVLAANMSKLTVQFNVPLSSSSGGLRFPPASDQYDWVGRSAEYHESAGPGRDWGVFLTKKNSVTGKYAGQAQGAYFKFGSPPGYNGNTRITGYGTDSTPRSYNCVNQTSTGPYLGNSGSRLMYRVDTMGGNSGSPVINVNTGKAFGVHTHGGCSYYGGYNSGTLYTYSPFYRAIKKLSKTKVYAKYTYYGSGCSGTKGVPMIMNNGVPKIGSTFQIQVVYFYSNAPAMLITGFSDKSWGNISLPYNLWFYGAPKCNLLASIDRIDPTVLSSTGFGSVKFVVPNLTSLISANFYNQWMVVDPKANALGGVFSKGGKGLVGE